MREIHWLRHTLLVALGLPTASLAGLSCGSTSSEPDRPETPIVRRPDPTAAQIAPLDAACIEPGYVCVYDERGCAPDASGHEQTSYTGKYKGNDWGPEAYNGKTLVFDPTKTKATRAEAFPGQEPLNYCCYSGCPAYDEADASMAEVAPPSDIISCVVPAPKVAFPAAEAPQCSASIRVDGHYRAFLRLSEERCCYPTGRSRGNLGRPLREAGHVSKVTSVDAAAGSRTASSTLDVTRYTLEERAAHAKTWHDAALLEHASVAAFAKISLELLAFGAPAELVRAAHEAAIDELAHAALCTEIAQAFGATVKPGPHAAAARVLPATDLEAFVRETIEDGCIGEAVAALEAKRAARDCQGDETLTNAYETIAEDEARHAALAWRIVAWAITHDVAMRQTIATTIASVESRGAHAEVIHGIVRPCAAAMMAAS